MLFFIYFIQDFLQKALGYKDKQFKFSEPFNGLFTQGMVCHQTYKITITWLSPDEVSSNNGIDFFLKNDQVKSSCWTL